MAGLCGHVLARAPEVFKGAVSGAPVTAWTVMIPTIPSVTWATPQSNPDGYHDAA